MDKVAEELVRLNAYASSLCGIMCGVLTALIIIFIVLIADFFKE